MWLVTMHDVCDQERTWNGTPHTRHILASLQLNKPQLLKQPFGWLIWNVNGATPQPFPFSTIRNSVAESTVWVSPVASLIPDDHLRYHRRNVWNFPDTLFCSPRNGGYNPFCRVLASCFSINLGDSHGASYWLSWNDPTILMWSFLFLPSTTLP